MKRYPDLDVEAVMANRFRIGSPRSQEYRQGFRDRLVQLRDGGRVESRWAGGTCQADAWYAGLNHAEDHVRWLDERGELPREQAPCRI